MWRSSSVLITQKDLSSSRSAGWSNERSHGSGDAGVSPKIGRISTERRSHFCASLQSGSCSENYAIPHDLSGQTLSAALKTHGYKQAVLKFEGHGVMTAERANAADLKKSPRGSRSQKLS